MSSTAEQRIAEVQSQAPDVQTGEYIAEGSHWLSMGMGLKLACGGGWLGAAIFGAGVGGGYLGAWAAQELHTADYLASGLEMVGMHKIGKGGEHPATVGHQVAHSHAFAGFLAAVAIGVVAAVAVGAVILSGGTALVAIGAAFAGGVATGFLGTTVSGALAQLGTQTGPVITGSPDLLICGRPAARMTDVANCSDDGSAPVPLVEGSKTILVNGLPMARIGHKLMCGAVVDEGAASVMIDKTVVACAIPKPEVPVYARIVADWIGFLPWGKVSAFLAGETPVNASQTAYQKAQSSALELPKNKTVASDGIQTVSGWSKNEGFTSVPPEDVAAYSDKIGHELQPAGGLDQIKNGGFPGKYNASHAEKQMAVASPNEPIGVSREICNDCYNFFKLHAQETGKPQIITDPEGTHVFYPDGTVKTISK